MGHYFRAEVFYKNGEKRRKLNTKEKKFITVWLNMKDRCYNKEAVSYYSHGGRGIKICERWQDFKNFYKDMYDSYEIDLQIDRVDNNSDYQKENCKWSTKKEQANNKRNNRKITYQGITKTMAQWIEKLGLKRSTVEQRFYVYKWNIEKCFEYRRANWE
jgi:hypothetical protein